MITFNRTELIFRLILYFMPSVRRSRFGVFDLIICAKKIIEMYKEVCYCISASSERAAPWETDWKHISTCMIDH